MMPSLPCASPLIADGAAGAAALRYADADA